MATGTSFFRRLSGNYCKKSINITLEECTNYDRNYEFIELGAKVSKRMKDNGGNTRISILVPDNEDLKLHSRVMVSVNPKLNKFGAVSSQTVFEAGEDIEVVVHGSIQKLPELPYIFRIYVPR